MSVRVYTLSAIAVTASAVAGLWFGVFMARSDNQGVYSGRQEAAVTPNAVISTTHVPRP